MAQKSKLRSAITDNNQHGLTVTAQQSRFQVDAEDNEGTSIKEIIVKDLSISLGQRDLLRNAELHLQPGRHYVLVGRNGVGKSTLLTALANGGIPGIPRSARIMLLGQSQLLEDEANDVSDPANNSVLKYVVRSNKQREVLLHEASMLSEAIDKHDDPTFLVGVHRELMHRRLEQKVTEAKQKAARRSGGRGLKARRELSSQEDELSQSFQKLQMTDVDETFHSNGPVYMAEEAQKAYEMLADVQSRLDLMNASLAEVRARSVLLGLGFSTASLEQPVSHLSGGWQTRCSLACALCQPADMLLLDEPTNFLDLPSLIWLESYLKNLGSSTIIVVVTHDRAFADCIGEELLIIRNQELERFRGNLSTYELTRIRNYKYLSRMQDAQEKQIKHMQNTIDQNVKAARRSGDDKKLKQATSRKKKVHERMGMEVSTKGTRFKLNRDRAGWHESSRGNIELPKFDPPVTLSLPLPITDLRFPGALLSFEDVSFGYGQCKPQLPILRNVTLSIHHGDRVGLVGLNGSGKSTLVSLAMSGVAGCSEAVTPTRGTIDRHSRARFGLYTQQTVAQLDAIAAGRLSATALTHFMDFVGAQIPEQDARGHLASLGLSGRTASDVPITLLSGGQKVRLALAKLLWEAPHLLILDEVTTHMDADTIQALAVALQKYEGAILVVTHDRFFMKCVVEGQSPRRLIGKSSTKQACAALEDGDDDDDDDNSSDQEDEITHQGRVYLLEKGKLIKLEGGMQQYENRATMASSKLTYSQSS